MPYIQRTLVISFLLWLIPLVGHAQKVFKPDDVIIVNEPDRPVPVDIIDRDRPLVVSGEVSVTGPVEVKGVVDAYVLNSASNNQPIPEDFIILSSTNQEVAGTNCKGTSRPLLRRFGQSSQNNHQFIVPSGKQMIITDFSWTADLREGSLSSAAAVAGVLSTTGGNGASFYWTPFETISEGDLVANGSENFKTGLIAREGAEVCIMASFIRLSDGGGPFTAPLGNFGAFGTTTVHGYLVDLND